MINTRGIKLVLTLTLSMILLFSCSKEDATQRSAQDDSQSLRSVYLSGQDVKADFQGLVMDENAVPMSGVDITIGSRTTMTDSDGRFSLLQVTVDQQRAYVTAELAGYFHGSRVLIPSTNGMNKVRISMLPLTVTGVVESEVGGEVSHSSGAKLTFTDGNVSTSAGEVYTGQVHVAMTYLDPMSETLSDIMPGDLSALDEQDRFGMLLTYGMIGVELMSPSGEELQVMAGETVDVQIPIPADQASSAPESIPLWHFDEIEGVWKEEGQALRDGDVYVGQVSHFSFWNCDSFESVVNLSGVINTNNGATGVQGVSVQITLQDGSGFAGVDVTDADGAYGGNVPADIPLLVEFFSPCGELLYTESVPALTEDYVLSPFDYPQEDIITISGVALDCNGDAISSGYVLIDTPAEDYTAQLNADGSFLMTTALCDGFAGNLTVFSNLTQWTSDSEPVTGPPGGNITIATITFSGICQSSIEGIAQDCSGSPLTDGVVTVSLDGDVLGSTMVESDGSYTVDIAGIESTQDVDVFITDADVNFSTSFVATVNPGSSVTVATAQVCDVYEGDYLLFEVEGQVILLTDALFSAQTTQPATLATSTYNVIGEEDSMHGHVDSFQFGIGVGMYTAPEDFDILLELYDFEVGTYFHTIYSNSDDTSIDVNVTAFPTVSGEQCTGTFSGTSQMQVSHDGIITASGIVPMSGHWRTTLD